MYNLLIALNAVVPFLIELAFGYLARRLGVFDDAFANKMNAVIFRLFFPCLTFYNIYNASWDAVPSARLLVTAVVSLLGLIVFLCLVVPHIVTEHTRTGVVIQAIYRSNMVLYGIPLTVSLFGDEAAVLAAMLVTICITIYNVSAVVVLEMFRNEGRTSIKTLAIGVCKNPLLQGAAVGLVMFLLQIRIPSSIESVISAFSSMTSPLALFLLGATMHFSEVGKNLRCIAVTLGIKLFVLPAIALVGGYALGLRELELFILVMMYATPIAASSYPMAQNMGSDGELAGQLVVISTAVTLVTLFLWIYIMKVLAVF